MIASLNASPTRRILTEVLLLFALGASALWFGSQVVDIWQNSGLTDFDILFHSAQRLAQGSSPYDVNGLRAAPFGGYYKFPPLVDVILARFTQFDWMQVAHVYLALGLLFYFASFVLLVRIEHLAFRSPPFYLLAIAFLVFQPSLDTLNGAQHEFLLLLLFTIAYWGMHQPHVRQAVIGVCIALTVIIKLYPLLLVVYLVMRRWWTAVIALFATLAGLTLFSIATTGWELERQFWFEILPSLSGATAWLENQSFFGFFARLFVNGAAVDPARVTFLPTATYLAYIAIGLGLLVSLIALYRGILPEYCWAILVPLMLLIGPNAWIHYETLLLLPLAILLALLWERAPAWQWLALGGAVFLVAFGNEDTVRNTTLGIIQSYKFFGVLIFWLLGVIRAWQALPEADAHSRISFSFLMRRGSASV